MLNTKRAPLANLLQRFHPSEGFLLLALAVLVGLATGLGVWVFRGAIGLFHQLFVVEFARFLGTTLGQITGVVSLALAGYLVGWLMQRFVGAERHRGVAGIIEAVALAGGRLRYRVILAKSLASSISLGAGASLGAQDPSVQIGANIGSMLGQQLHLNEDRIRLLVAAGAASAIAAAFNAPIAGVFFALEVVLLEFTTGAFGVVVLAAVVASVLSQAIEQTTGLHEPALNLLNYQVGSILEMPIYALLGLALAPLAALFIRSLYWQQDLWQKHVRLPRPVGTALVGAVVGLVGIFLPEILGTGRQVMNEILIQSEGFTIGLLVVLGLTKIIMAGFSLAGGFVGGMFAPTLFIGLVSGAAFGRIVAGLRLTGTTSDPQVYAIVGMAAMLAGVVRSPITAIMLVFELTNDYRLILPIMLAAVVCIYLTNRFAPLGIYTQGLAREGIHLQEGRDVDLMQGVAVAEVMDDPVTIHENDSLVKLRDTLREYHVRSLAVVDDEGKLTGIVTLADLQQTYEEHPETVAQLKVHEICTRDVVTVYPDDVLWRAIRLMGARNVGRLPVVDAHTQQLVGILSRHDIVEAYNRAIARKLHDQHHAEQVRLNHLTGAHVLEVHITQDAPVVGQEIKDIHWPAESVVASVLRNNKLLVPHGNTQLRGGDWVTVVAAPEAEEELEVLFGQRPVVV